MFMMRYLRKKNWCKIRWQICKCGFGESFILENGILFLLTKLPAFWFFTIKMQRNEGIGIDVQLPQAYLCLGKRDCIWIIWLETCMSWDKYASISAMTTDDIFFLSKVGKAGIWGRPAPWPGFRIDLDVQSSLPLSITLCLSFPYGKRVEVSRIIV